MDFLGRGKGPIQAAQNPAIVFQESMWYMESSAELHTLQIFFSFAVRQHGLVLME